MSSPFPPGLGRRLLGSWPYLLFVAGAWAAWQYLIWVQQVDTDGIGWTDSLTLVLVWFPALVFVAGMVLGYRRGYDVVTVVAGFALWLCLWMVESLLAYGQLLAGDPALGILYYAAVAHLGIAAGLGVRALQHRRAER